MNSVKIKIYPVKYFKKGTLYSIAFTVENYHSFSISYLRVLLTTRMCWRAAQV